MIASGIGPIRRSGRGTPAIGLFAVLACIALPSVARAQTLQQLREMSIDDLAEVSVTSVSKSAQPLGEAAAAVYVIDHEDILRSGAATLPEMLRLAPNLQVYERAPGNWVITARGMNGNTAAQSFPNKLLVLIDGRTVYTPLFSGVYWDLPDVLPNDVDRIEVISGPGATLWGANAVNGVINVITRKSSETAGVYAGFRGGSNQRTAGMRIGGFAANDTLSYRVYARWLEEEGGRLPAGGAVGDGRDRLGGGFRLDWTPSATDTVSLQGEAFAGNLYQGPAAYEETSGRNLVLRWNHSASPRSELQAQLFYDRITRSTRPDGGSFFVDTYDAEFQHSLTLGSRNKLLWGAGGRVAHYRIRGTPNFFFDPASRDLFLADAFVQDSFQVTPRLTLTAGLKLEKDPYVGLSLLPEFRAAWKPNATTLVWGAVSRAVRSPTPFDVDVEERAGIVSLSGDRQFRTEKVTALEAGLRMQPVAALSFSINGYYNRYEDLRTVEIVPGPGLILVWGNGLKGHGYGVDAWADWRPTPWWTLSVGGSWIEKRLRFARGASGILGTSQLGDDPSHVIKIGSSMNLGRGVRLDANFRALGALGSSGVPAYQELSGRLAWFPTAEIALSVSASNLLHDRHLEYPGGDLIPRRVLAGVELRF
jgi:iron complex outermembrane receptor protein